MKFDTRDKKPKVYNIAVLTLITAAVLFPFVTSADTEQLKWGNAILAVYFLLVVFFLLVAFQRQLQYNPYSYNTILYSGFAFFFLSLLFTHSYLAVKGFQNPGQFSLHSMWYTLLNSGKNYLNLTSPLLIVFAGGLFASNIALIRHNGRGFVNYLAMVLAFAIIAGLLIIGIVNDHISSTDPNALVPNLILNIVCAVYLYFECLITGTVIADVIAAKYHPDPDKDFLIILGAGLEKDGTPSRILRERADLACAFYTDQIEKTGKTACFIPSGGQGSDEIISEAESIKAYLCSKNIPETQILPEDQSTNTAENMRFSKAIITETQPNGKIAFFTSDFHVFRAGLKARRVKMRAVGMGAPTRWYFWPNASVREFAGLMIGHRMKQAFVLAGLTAAYIILTFLTYA